MNILDFPNEILNYIINYLSVTDIRNFRLSALSVANRINSYNYNLEEILTYLVDIDIYFKVINIWYGDKRVTISDYEMWYENDEYTLYIEIYGFNPNCNKLENILYKELGYIFYGYNNMIEENRIYCYTYKKNDDRFRVLNKKVIELYKKIDIYDMKMIKSICEHIKIIIGYDNNFIEGIYINPNIIKNLNRLTDIEIYKLTQYICNNKICYKIINL